MRKDLAECVRLLKDAEPRIACCWLMDLALAAMAAAPAWNNVALWHHQREMPASEIGPT